MNDKGKLRVGPSNQIFNVLGNNDYDDVDLISELIDNALAAKLKNQRLRVVIEVGISDENPKNSYFKISDNASGIEFENLARAISPAGQPEDVDHPLNEHGLGMKQAIAAAGELEFLKTKPTDEDSATVISKFAYGEIDYETEDVDWDHGTQIKVRNLREILKSSDRVYGQRILHYLGARYRRMLGPPNDEMEIEIKWKNLDNDDYERKYTAGPINPIYFHPNERINKPIVENKKFSGPEGDGWSILLTFGYAPGSDVEYEKLRIESPSRYEPYSVALSKQGLDLMMHDRVIQFHQLEEIGLVKASHNQYNRIRGEIDMIEGFHTAITKNKIPESEQFNSMISKVKDFLNDKNLLDTVTVPGDIPENCLRDRLAKLLKKPPYNKKDVNTEYTVGKLRGFVDVYADGEAWEIKVDQGNGIDVYQLFGYMDMDDIEVGKFVSDGISGGARLAINHINEKHDVNIESINLKNLAINDSMSDEEIEKYL